jgi:hypothetical protein
MNSAIQSCTHTHPVLYTLHSPRAALGLRATVQARVKIRIGAGICDFVASATCRLAKDMLKTHPVAKFVNKNATTDTGVGSCITVGAGREGVVGQNDTIMGEAFPAGIVRVLTRRGQHDDDFMCRILREKELESILHWPYLLHSLVQAIQSLQSRY